MKLRNRRLGLLVLAVGLLLACDSWLAWDDVFKRSAVGPTARGWTGGDGAISAELPGGRALWLFGDSLITSYTAEGTRPQSASVASALATTAFGNTIAVQANRDAPAPSQVAFWGRDPAGASISITSNVAGGVRQFFNQRSLGMPAGAPELPLWPVGAECIECSGPAPRLLLSFVSWRLCDPNPSGAQTAVNCAPLCSAQGGSDGVGCHSGVELVSSVLARFKSLELEPSAWVQDGVVEIAHGADPVLWGAAFAATPNGTLIFGRRVFASELMVARAATNPLDAAQWQFWHGPGAQWSTDKAAQVAVAPAIGALVSVDKITRAATTRYLLTHGDVRHQLYARVSSDDASGIAPPLWPAPSAATPRIDLISIEASLRAQQADLIARGKCTPVSGGAVLDWSRCGTSYHGLAHAHLAIADASGPLALTSSYVVPYGPNPLFNPGAPEGDSNARIAVVDASYYRPKFTVIPLDKLKPWCVADCWEGLAHDYAQRPVGTQPQSLSYDVQQSTTFYASLTRVRGAASLRVEFFDGSRRLASITCPQDAASASVRTCKLSKPSGAKLARVSVSGAPDDVYALRTHYAGMF